MHRFRQLITISSAAGILLAASCGDDTDDGIGGPVDGTPGTSTEMCGKISADEISATLGIPGFTDPDPEATMNSTCDCANCRYEGDDHKYVTIIYYPDVSRSTFDFGRENTDKAFSEWDTEDAPGIGDAAYSYIITMVVLGDTMVTPTVTMLKGDTQVLITAGGATLDKVKQLAVVVASRL